MDATPATVSTWENNKTPVGRTADLLLRAIVMLRHGQQSSVSTFRGISGLLTEEARRGFRSSTRSSSMGTRGKAQAWVRSGASASRAMRRSDRAALAPRWPLGARAECPCIASAVGPTWRSRCGRPDSPGLDSSSSRSTRSRLARRSRSSCSRRCGLGGRRRLRGRWLGRQLSIAPFFRAVEMLRYDPDHVRIPA